MLVRPRAVGIVWVCNSADIDKPEPNYRLQHWRKPHSHGVGFAELNAYDMRELSAIISRTVPHNAIRYILGVTGEAHKERCLHRVFPLSYINYGLIENDEDISAWLLLNQALEDPLDLLVYCHLRYTADRVPTLRLRRHNYGPENAIANWARQEGAPTGIPVPRKEGRPDPGPTNAGGNQATVALLFLPLCSSSSSDVSNAGEGYEAIIGTSPSPVGDRTKYPHFRILLAIQSPSKMNTDYGWDLRGRRGETLDVKVRKCGVLSDWEDWEHLNKKLCQASNVREWLTAREEWECQAKFDDEKGDEDASSLKTLRLTLSAEGGGSECGRSDGASFVC